ncbi:UbiA family prenyltransferase [Luteolibacter pohnpeiensis]|uniref:UbiA family prenyltransferase n=1 Tax=Luteolibacter pohnpeiensis TaxID=454153 RepID=A0A934S4J6_9BACT|nr:UbiA family prenyltransferase [Luteolibacter pohnpeiensis]MBK1881773.1 UbiA family prenyltransferase [Luteolibacter pohnpeiensis]
MNPPSKLRSLLATARVANIPSVISNVAAGMVIASLSPTPPFWMMTAIIASLAGVLLYVSGNFLNDWQDRDWDAKHRPERALPQKLFSPGQYLIAARITGITGVVLASLCSPISGLLALGIMAAIFIYTKWHKLSPWAVIPMGFCRALLPLMGFFALSKGSMHNPHFWITASQAVGLLCYIAGLSLSARYESMAEPPWIAHQLSRALLVLSGLIIAIVWSQFSIWNSWLGLLPFGIWILLCLTIYRRPIPAHVSSLLAGIPLLDWIGLLPLGIALISAPTQGLMALICLILPPLAVVSGRALQKVAAAT